MALKNEISPIFKRIITEIMSEKDEENFKNAKNVGYVRKLFISKAKTFPLV